MPETSWQCFLLARRRLRLEASADVVVDSGNLAAASSQAVHCMICNLQDGDVDPGATAANAGLKLKVLNEYSGCCFACFFAGLCRTWRHVYHSFCVRARDVTATEGERERERNNERDTDRERE